MVELPPLWDHQEQAVEYGTTVAHPILLMEMRTGKNRTTIHIIKRYKDKPKRILIATRISAFRGWKNDLTVEGETWHSLDQFKHLKREDIANVLATADYNKRNWLVMNHEAIRCTPEISMMPWDAVILDESVVIAYPLTQVTTIFTMGFRGVPHRFLLTGLIDPESRLQIFMQMKYVHGEFMGYTDFYKWREKFFYHKGYDWVPRLGTVTRIKNEIKRLAFEVTRKQAKIGGGKIYTSRGLKLPPKLLMTYKNMEKYFDAECIGGEILETQYALEQYTILMKYASGFDPEGNVLSTFKLDELMYLLTTDLRGAPVVITATFIREIEEIYDRVVKLPGFCAVIHGGIKANKREDIETAFLSGALKYVIAQDESVKYGANFSIADTMIRFSRSARNDTDTQVTDRLIHGTKRTNVFIIDLITEGTVDEDRYTDIRDKKDGVISSAYSHLSINGIRRRARAK